jgi:NDP-sugar pyrophosphorylase family protein
MKYDILENDYRSFLHPHTEQPVRVYRVYYTEDFEWQNPFTDSIVYIKNGTIGGYIQSEINLSQTDNSIVLNTAVVFGNATITNTIVRDNATVFDNAAAEHCEIFGYSRIFGKTNAKYSIFRDHCNVGGILELEQCYISNSTQISGVCKLHSTEMYNGSVIRGQCTVRNSTLLDVSEISGVSTVINCKLSGRGILQNGKFVNQTVSERVILNSIIKDGDLFPH